MDVSHEELFKLAQYAFTRLDGAWFLAVADKLGREAAWEADVAAWRHLAYVLGKRIKAELIPEPVWPESLAAAMEIFSRLMMIEGRETTIDDERVIVTTTDCEVQRMIAKAGVADCGIATKVTYQGLAKGLFGKDFKIVVEHPTNLNAGDEVCEVIVRRTQE